MPLARAPVIKAAWTVSAVLPHHNRIIHAHVASIKVPSLFRYLKEIEKPYLEYQPMDRYIDAYNDFYDEILVHESVTVD